jgi:hypothetical protein
MLDIRNPVRCLISMLAVSIALFLGLRQFSAKARVRRRREKSHRQVISRKQGPTVRLAVDVDKPKRGRKD